MESFYFTTTNKKEDILNYPNTLLARSGDLITLNYLASERIDNDSIYPEIYFLNGSDNFSVDKNQLFILTMEKIGKAILSISSLPDNTENFLGFRIILYDEAGNQKIVEFLDDNETLSQSLPFSSCRNNKFIK